MNNEEKFDEYSITIQLDKHNRAGLFCDICKSFVQIEGLEDTAILGITFDQLTVTVDYHEMKKHSRG